MIDEHYHGYRNENEYHESYSLAGMIEQETDQIEKEKMEARLKEIEAARLPGTGCTGFNR